MDRFKILHRREERQCRMEPLFGLHCFLTKQLSKPRGFKGLSESISAVTPDRWEVQA